MKRMALNILISLVLGISAQTVFGQGPLTPPGPPAPMFKTLQQIEPRTAITNATAVTISASGSYYLTTNFTVTTGDAITITANNVTLDLNGFTISSTAASATGTGILLSGGLRNITIQNGFIQGGVTNNGSGVYGGTGLALGIYYSGASPVNVLVSRVSIAGVLFHGMHLGYADSTVVDSCMVSTAGGAGIISSVIKSSAATDCGGSAISGNEVMECRGVSTGSGYGVAAGSAHNCSGQSKSSVGLGANCANNCFGVSSSGTGLAASQIAIGCVGFSISGTGLVAVIANSCLGAGSQAVSATYKYNMP